MYTVNRIYIETHSSIKYFNLSDLSPTTLKYIADVNTHIYLAIDNNETHEKSAVDFCRMVTDQDINTATTWDEFSERLTDALVLGYAAELPCYDLYSNSYTNPVQIWDALASLKTFNLDYGDCFSGKYNLYMYRYRLEDLRITVQDEASEYPNLKRCLPIVNGFACRPYYDKTKEVLWAMDGAHLCWHDYTPATPEVQLLDFTEVGDIEITSIHDSNHYDERVDTLYTQQHQNSRWYFSFPNYSLNEWTPIFVLGGLMIMPDQYKAVSSTRVSIDVNKIPFNKALALKKVLQASPVTPAGIAYHSLPYEEYLETEFARDISKDTFVVFVHKPRLYVSRESVDVWRNEMCVNLYSPEGLVMNDATYTVRNYHRDTYSDCKELTIQNSEIIRIGDDAFPKDQLCFINPDCKHHNFEDINRSRCTIVRLLGA